MYKTIDTILSNQILKLKSNVAASFHTLLQEKKYTEKLVVYLLSAGKEQPKPKS